MPKRKVRSQITSSVIHTNFKQKEDYLIVSLILMKILQSKVPEISFHLRQSTFFFQLSLLSSLIINYLKPFIFDFKMRHPVFIIEEIDCYKSFLFISNF